MNFVDLENFSMLKIAPALAIWGVDTAENGPKRMYDVTPLHLHAIQSPEYRSKTSANDNETLLY